MNAGDATRIAGDAYKTRLAREVTENSEGRTRLVQEGHQSKLARQAANVESCASELYKIGEKIGGRYEVSAIHHGAMGVVFGCFDHETKLPRALKTVQAQYAHEKQMLAMFESEAAVWISLEKHPYIVRAYLVERFKNLTYVITEYVRGPDGMEGDLRGWLGHPSLTLPVAVTMALQIAQGMQHAVHKVPNLVHRDLKPANILVNGDGKAMVTDFGLVDVTESGAGTPAYMSPELWRGEPLDGRSDIYAYGCILFEMFTGHRLFNALTEHEWEGAHLEKQPVKLVNLAPNIPVEIDCFVRHCLEKNYTKRPQNWDEVVAFFAEWYYRLTGKAVIFDFSSLALDAAELITASYSLSNLNRYQEMLWACERSLAIDKKNAASWNNKGSALMGLLRYDEAIQAFDSALFIDENWLKAARNKCRALLGAKRLGEMLLACNRAIAISPKTPEEWNNKSIALRGLGRYEESLVAADQSIFIDPTYFLALNAKGSALCGLNRYAEAIQAFDLAISIHPDNIAAWMEKGTAFFNLQFYEESVQAWEKALTIDRNNQSAWYNMGVTLSRLGRGNDAINAYKCALTVDPNNLNAWFNLGNALFVLCHFDEALNAYDQALAIDPNCLSAWLDKGSVLCNLKRFQEAIHAYDRVLLIDANLESAIVGRRFASDALKTK